MKRLDSNIVKIQKIMGVSNLITEASKKDVLINKIGLDPEIAEWFDRTCGGLAVIMFKKWIKRILDTIAQYQEGVTEKDVIAERNKLKNIPLSDRQKIQSIMDWVRVGLNGRLNQYQNLEFSELYNKSREWHDSLSLGQGDINYIEENTIIKDFRDENGEGFYWVDLNTNVSDEECNRMGHCGRTGSNNDLYSLRETKKLPGGKFTLNRSHLTASIGYDGILYQLKGPKNSKPQEEFHQYILPLFFVLGGGGEEVDFLIRGFGSEYASNLDFKITDLPDETIKQLYEQRPELFESYSLRRKLKEMGLIEMPSFPTFTYSIILGSIDNYVDGNWVMGKRRWTDANGNKRESKTYFFETLLTEPWDIWENYDSDWRGAVSYYLNDKNEKKIREYLISLSENPEEHKDDSTTSLIEEFDDNNEVKNAISSSVNDAEADDYIDTLRKHLESKLEEYGTVLKLNDEGAEIQIDLQSFVDNHVSNDEWFFELLENCGDTNYECIFEGIVDDYSFDKPRWNFDDRYIPDVNEENFNDILSDRLSDFIR